MTWNDYYTIAEKYYRRHGTIDTPSTCWCMGKNIGAWLMRQRICHLPDAPHPLDAHQVELLDELHMDWKIRRRDWEVCFGCAERYFAEHGNLRVPTAMTVRLSGGQNDRNESDDLIDRNILDHFNLSDWLVKQRQRYNLYNSGTYTDEEISARRKVGKPLTEDQISRLESIGMNWAPHDNSWERSFAVAERYYKEHGNLSIPKHYEVDGVNLSHWIWAQRRMMLGTDPSRKRRLTEEQVRRLESIGMEWTPKSKGFGYYYDQTKKFYEAYGHTDFPEGEVYVGEERLPESGEQLLAWKHEQEQYLKNYEQTENVRRNQAEDAEKNVSGIRNQQTRHTFAAHRKLLIEIGINPTNWEIPWEKNYRFAEAYYRTNGNLLVPFYYKTEDGIALGKWISQQRLKKKSTQGTLSEDQIERLEKIGMVWDTGGKRTKRRQNGKKEIRRNTAWDRAYEIAEKYYKEHGDLLVPKGYIEDGFHLYAWIARQRHRYLLDHNAKYAYGGNERSEIHGIQNESNSSNEIAEKRSDNDEPLTEEQISRLEAIGMVWNLFDYAWDRSFAVAQAYYKAHGNLYVPTDYCADGVNLNNWLQTQRRIRSGAIAGRKSPLTDEQIRKLDSIGMLWQPGNIRWERSFAVAEKYYKKHGNLSVPKNYEEDGVRLGRWISTQRMKRNGTAAGKLSEEQIQRLDAIGMVWNVRS